MRRLIAIFSFAFIWATVSGVVRCPFPGSTAHAAFMDKSISWQDRPSFEEGEKVTYECQENWPVEGVQYSLTCQSDGSWSGPLPVCGNFI
jgi:hypothetical protein